MHSFNGSSSKTDVGISNHLTITNLPAVKESKWLVKCFLNYLRHEKSEVNVLFDILFILLFHSRIDYTFLREFYIIEVAEEYPPNMKRAIVLHFLNLFQSKQLAHEHLVQIVAIGTLALCYNNVQVFRGAVKLRSGLIAKVIDRTKTMDDVYGAFYDFSCMLTTKVDKNDPNAMKTLNRLETIKKSLQRKWSASQEKILL